MIAKLNYPECVAVTEHSDEKNVDEIREERENVYPIRKIPAPDRPGENPEILQKDEICDRRMWLRRMQKL